MLERVAGIEPASSAWKAEVIAIIRYPHMVPTTGIKLVPTDYKSVALPAELSRHWFFRGAISPIKEEFPLRTVFDNTI